MIFNSFLAYHNSLINKRKKWNADIGKCIKRMNQFKLWNIFIYPGTYFVTKITLPVKNNRLLLLAVDITSDHTAINKIQKIKPLIISIN